MLVELNCMLCLANQCHPEGNNSSYQHNPEQWYNVETHRRVAMNQTYSSFGCIVDSYPGTYWQAYLRSCNNR